MPNHFLSSNNNQTNNNSKTNNNKNNSNDNNNNNNNHNNNNNIRRRRRKTRFSFILQNLNTCLFEIKFGLLNIRNWAKMLSENTFV